MKRIIAQLILILLTSLQVLHAQIFDVNFDFLNHREWHPWVVESGTHDGYALIMQLGPTTLAPSACESLGFKKIDNTGNEVVSKIITDRIDCWYILLVDTFATSGYLLVDKIVDTDGQKQLQMVTLDAAGYVLTKIKYNGGQDYNPFSVVRTSNGNLAVLSKKSIGLSRYFTISEFTPTGELVADYNYGLPLNNDYYVPGSILQHPNGGYLFTSVVDSVFSNFSTGHVGVFRTNAAGELLWTNTELEFPFHPQEVNPFITPDGQLYVLRNNFLGDTVSLTKFNDNGQIAWNNDLYDIFRRSIGNDFFREKIMPAPDGGVILAGAPRNGFKPLVARIEPVNGNVVWQLTTDAIDGFPYEVIQDGTGNYAIVNNVRKPVYEPPNWSITRFSPDGEIIGYQLFEKPEWNVPGRFILSSDEAFVVGGTNIVGDTLIELRLLKTQRALPPLASAAQPSLAEMPLVKYFPNPSKGSLTIHFPTVVNGEFDLCLIDVLGRTVFTQHLDGTNPTLDLHQLPNGVYTLALKQKGAAAVLAGKIVLSR